MRYLVGTMTDLNKTWRALDQLSGYPRASAMPSPPRPAVYYEGALGWTGHLVQAPVEVADGSGLLELPENPDVDAALGQTTTVDGESISVPAASELLARGDLSQAYQDWLDVREQGDPNVPDPSPPLPPHGAP